MNVCNNDNGSQLNIATIHLDTKSEHVCINVQ